MGSAEMVKKPETPEEKRLPGEFSEAEIQEFIQTIAEKIVRRGMSVPAIFSLELMKPVSLISSASLTVCQPLLEVLVSPQQIEKMAFVLGDRDRVESLLVAIETLEHKQK